MMASLAPGPGSSPKDRICLSDQEALAVSPSEEALWDFTRQQLSTPPKACLQVTAPAGESGRKRFPFNNFTCYLTLFSKCFSSFDHSTCALSVSGQYSALDGIYHLFRAAFPNNSTRRRSFTRTRPSVPDGILILTHHLRAVVVPRASCAPFDYASDAIIQYRDRQRSSAI
ncbi:hypothetical protein VTN00DRAFT_4363 [Thermoascus crustaceus]